MAATHIFPLWYLQTLLLNGIDGKMHIVQNVLRCTTHNDHNTNELLCYY